MSSNSTLRFTTSLPAQLLYVPIFRNYVADILSMCDFDNKFKYQAEIIVDELCSNAITHGSNSHISRIDITVIIEGKKVTIEVKDEGASKENNDKLLDMVNNGTTHDNKMGLGIIKNLSNTIDISIKDNGDKIVSVTKIDEVIE